MSAGAEQLLYSVSLLHVPAALKKQTSKLLFYVDRRSAELRQSLIWADELETSWGSTHYKNGPVNTFLTVVYGIKNSNKPHKDVFTQEEKQKLP